MIFGIFFCFLLFSLFRDQNIGFKAYFADYLSGSAVLPFTADSSNGIRG
jgi:hypothetical protein